MNLKPHKKSAHSVVVSVQDQDRNTDNIILVNTKERTLTWIPRDLFSVRLLNRINVAFIRGGHELLLKTLKSLGYPADYSICIPNLTMRSVLKNCKVVVPVDTFMQYYYPATPFQPLEEGGKIISFSPPEETLEGERIHQFLGARTRVTAKEYTDLPDFERIKRQMVFVKQLLKDKFNFEALLTYPIEISNPDALNVIAQVTAEYQMVLYNSVKQIKINTRDVLIPKKLLSLIKGYCIKYLYHIYHFILTYFIASKNWLFK